MLIPVANVKREPRKNLADIRGMFAAVVNAYYEIPREKFHRHLMPPTKFQPVVKDAVE